MPDKSFGLQDFFALREIARESWDYFFTNKLIRSNKPAQRYDGLGIIVPEQDINNRGWFEIQIWLGGCRKSHYAAIVENLLHWPKLLRQYRNIDPEHAGMESEVPMLIDIPQSIENPKQVHLISTPCIVRLKKLHDGDCAFGQATSCASNPRFGSVCVLPANREFRTPMLHLSDARQSKDEMVQGRAEAAQEVTEDCANRPNRGNFKFNSDNVLSGIEIVSSGNFIRLGCDENVDFALERIQVLLRPTQLQIGIGQTLHNARHDNRETNGVRLFIAVAREMFH